MLLQIRNMESNRCKTMVKDELNKLGFSYKSVDIGTVELHENISKENMLLIDESLRKAGLEIIENKKLHLVEKIKTAIHQLINFSEDLPKPKFSDYISECLKCDYAYLSNLFTHEEGVTIEKYVIAQKIERVKKLLLNGEFSLSDIAYKLQYSSVAHLSNQFKKITGLTPSFYRQLFYCAENNLKDLKIS